MYGLFLCIFDITVRIFSTLFQRSAMVLESFNQQYRERSNEIKIQDQMK